VALRSRTVGCCLLLSLFFFLCVYSAHDRGRGEPTRNSSIQLPTSIVQFGRPRTSSTTQTCILMIIKCFRPAIKEVKKLHRRPKFNSGKTWYFQSAMDNKTLSAAPVKAIHYRRALMNEGFPYLERSVSRVYGPLFGLSSQERTDLLDYMRLWNVLRQCCGLQLSKPYAEQLRQPGTPKTHYCWGINATQAEEEFVKSPIVLRCAKEVIGLGSTSEYDQELAGEMDGHYCQRTQKLWEHGMRFNGRNLKDRHGTLRMPYGTFLAHNVAAKASTYKKRAAKAKTWRNKKQPGT